MFLLPRQLLLIIIYMTHQIHETVEDNNDESCYKSGFIALSGQRHKWDRISPSELSTQSSNCLRMVPYGKDRHVDQLLDMKRDLQDAVHQIAIKYNFEFKVKRSKKSTNTIICVDDSCSQHLRTTKGYELDIYSLKVCTRSYL